MFEIALIGAGNLGRRHFEGLLKIPGEKCIRVVDPSATSLEEARRWLERAFAAGRAAIAAHGAAEWDAPLPDGPIMGGAPRFTVLGAIRDHTAHHRGALAVYARLRGKVPPMPYIEAAEA